MIGSHYMRQNCESGVRELDGEITPDTYASELARYITSASTIRARTLDRFGRSPSMDRIKAMQDGHRAERDGYRAMSPAPALSDAQRFTVPRIGLWPHEQSDKPQKRERKPRAKPVKRVPSLPEEIASTVEEIAGAFGLSVSDILSQKRARPYVLARRTACYVLYRRGQLCGNSSYPTVGKWLRRDHTTVIHACEQFQVHATTEMREVADRHIMPLASRKLAEAIRGARG